MKATSESSVPRSTGHSSSRLEARGAAKTRTFLTHCLGLSALMVAGTRDRRGVVSDDPSGALWLTASTSSIDKRLSRDAAGRRTRVAARPSSQRSAREQPSGRGLLDSVCFTNQEVVDGVGPCPHVVLARFAGQEPHAEPPGEPDAARGQGPVQEVRSGTPVVIAEPAGEHRRLLAGVRDTRPHSSAGRHQLGSAPVSYTHLRAHETDSYLVCRLLLE